MLKRLFTSGLKWVRACEDQFETTCVDYYTIPILHYTIICYAILYYTILRYPHASGDVREVRGEVPGGPARMMRVHTRMCVIMYIHIYIYIYIHIHTYILVIHTLIDRIRI